ncbi:hypothetical protein FKW77_009920 [Venturia effusa]|uniref:SMP domain-containing protein n=1 Tax=Venturia effusa TaxID=50376 RepID=A0A517L463_9PEZI|nr:hypothetical protein FKW77_009920 [Venturia effusa]
MSFLTSRLPSITRASISRPSSRFTQSPHRYFSARTAAAKAANLNSENLSKITDAEKRLTGQDQPVKGGPTAQAQKHANEPITSQALHDVTQGEKKVTGGERVKGGPTSTAQSILSKSGGNQAKRTSSSTISSSSSNQSHNGTLDADTISKITEKEKQITGSDEPVKGGPTAQAQKHANQPITSEALHDITEGEKKITGGERLKGGPTSAAQSELGKSRS